MASFVYAVWSITNVASVHCSVRPEISPCTCEPVYANNYVELSCEKVDSFHKIVDALSNKFEPNISISLKISHSQLDDLEMRSFSDMNLNVVKLRLQWNGLRSVPELPFRGLSNVEFLSVGDNELEEIPKHVLNHLPLIKTLDMGRGRIRSVLQDDLKGIQMVTNLFLPSNNIVRLDKGSFPPGMLTLHLGRNQIESLNGSLRELHKLESLFINMNSIETLENELPESYRLKLILAQNNRLKQLPQTMKYLDKLETLHIQNNMLRSFDGVLKNAKNLNLLLAFNNEIEYLAKDEFQESELLEELNLSYNHIKSLNGSLLPMRRLFVANFSFNDIDEFSMNEIRGLKHLKQLDMSYNFIQKLTGRQENNIDQHSFLIEFNLDHNRLKSLDGALMGLNRLRILSLSHNQIERILPEDFIGLEKLELLELSHNHLMTLKEMATTFLPNLKILKVAFNNLTILEKDFHGLPILCQANLTNNQISSISQELVSETRCMNHNVPGKLEIFLENNPIICDHAMSDLCPMMISQKARIRGKCPPFNKEQEICDLPFIYPQDIPLIIKQLSHQALPPNGKPIIQLIVPSTNKFKKPEEILPPLLESLGGQPMIKPLIIPLTTSTSTTTTTTSTTTTTTTTTTPAPTTSTTVVPTTTQQVPNITMIEDISLLQSEVETPTTTTTTSAPNTTNITLIIEEPATTTITYTTTTLLVDPLTSADVLPEDPPVVLDIAAAELPLSKVNQESTSSHLTEVNAASNAVIVAPSSLLESDVHQTEYPTVEYIPNLDQFMPGNHPPNVLEEETNNSVHEEFPSVVLSDLDNAQQSLLIPAEPPENPKN